MVLQRILYCYQMEYPTMKAQRLVVYLQPFLNFWVTALLQRCRWNLLDDPVTYTCTCTCTYTCTCRVLVLVFVLVPVLVFVI